MTLIAICLAILIGVAVADLHPLSTSPLLLSSALALAAAVLARHSRLWRNVALLTGAAALGAVRASLQTELPILSGIATSAEALLSTLAPLRQSAQAAIAAYLPEPDASLAAGMLLGGSGHLDASFKLDLQRSGLGHLLAIDGFKQVLVAATVSTLTTRLLGPRLALPPTLAVVASYTLLAGAHPSAVRAALMVALAGVARLSGRIADPLTSLGLALTAMAMLEPRVLFDLGLQLSLSATLGIVLLWPILRRRLRLYRWPRLLAEPIGLSLAVSLGCLPLTLSVFGLVSLVSPVAHVLAVPLLPLILLASAALALAAALPALAAALAWLVWLPTSLLVAIVRGTGSLPGAALSTGRVPPQVAFVLAALLLAWGIWNMPEFRELRLGWHAWQSSHAAVRQPLALSVACLAAAASVQCLTPDRRVHVEPLALTRGQASFIRGPTGYTAVVVLGSADGFALATQVGQRLPVWQHQLDAVIALDGSAARAFGPTLTRYPAAQRLEGETSLTLDVGDNQSLSVSAAAGQLSVEPRPTTSAQTTSAARPESAD